MTTHAQVAEYMARLRAEQKAELELQTELIREIRALGFDACSDMAWYANSANLSGYESARRPRSAR